MGFWQRSEHRSSQAKGNKALDRLEDPRQTLDLSYDKQLENLTKVRRAVADVATARKRIELQANELKKQGDKLQAQAKAALSQGNEDLARVALERRTVIAGQLTDLEAQHQQVADQEQKLIETSRRLQAEVESFRTRKETITRPRTPPRRLQTHIGEAVAGHLLVDERRRGQAMQRAQDKIAQDAGLLRRDGRAVGERRADRPVPPDRRHPGPARQGLDRPSTSTPSSRS